MKTKFTAIALDTMPEGVHWDTLCPGLAFRIGKKRKTWQYKYRQNGQQKLDTLGHYPKMSLADARASAGKIDDQLEAGEPVEKPKAVHPRSEVKQTLGQLFDAYEKARLAKAAAVKASGAKKPLKGIKTLPEAMRTVRRNLKKYLDKPACDFTKAQLREVRDEIATRAPQMSDRFMSYLGTIMKWAAQEDHIETNFVPDTLKVGPGLVKRERVLTPDEMRSIWNACAGPFESNNGAAYGRLVRFLMVMGQRKMEGGKLKHGDIIDGRWKQKEDANKSGREHWLALPKLALDQIGTGSANALCFAGEQGGIIGNFSQLKEELDKLSGVTGWRHHDLRRTASTHLQEQGFAPHIIDAVLNHAIPGVGGHYMHGALNDAKSEAVAAWAEELQRILNDRRAKRPRVVS